MDQLLKGNKLNQSSYKLLNFEKLAEKMKDDLRRKGERLDEEKNKRHNK
jgi:hypothetical protein